MDMAMAQFFQGLRRFHQFRKHQHYQWVGVSMHQRHRCEKHGVRVAQKALLPTRRFDHLLYWVSRELSLSKLQDQIPSRTRRPLLMGSPAAAQGHKSDDGPTAMKHQPRHKDHLARYGSDHRSSPEFLDRRNRGRVDEKLAIVGGGLDEKDPAVGSPNTAPSRLEPSDVQPRVFIVPGQDLVPAVINPWPSP